MKTRKTLLAAAALIAGGCGSSSPTAPGNGSLQLDIAVCAPGAGPFSTNLSNPFFSLPPGTVWVLTGREDGASVRLEVHSLAETETVAGVLTRVVEEREWKDDQVIEISRNFFVQTSNGTVCYYGEDVDIYENGAIASHDGAWRAGGGNLPGIFMPANPTLGQQFQQEVAPGIAVDEARIVATGQQVTVPLGSFGGAIRVEDFNPLDGGRGVKTYAPGVGLLTDDSLERIR